ncbi:MAG: NADP-dependent malic enzyme [Thermoplasmata archaeon]|nr:NADP-dependent malic enzyme [Thermoplasmata archaeon]
MVEARPPRSRKSVPLASPPPEETAESEASQTAALSERALRLARYYRGKVETVPKVPVRSLRDFSLWYTPGIAAVSEEIKRDPARAFDLTGRWNTIAVLTDGSRVLGLGNIGPQAALPVMEGKALLFKYLGGVDAVPLPVDVSTPEALIETALRIAPAFGGINLEDIASPNCFQVLEELQRQLPIPVWHDDQLGTAAATLAGLINALQLTGRTLASTRTVLLGAGAANLATARLLIRLGHDPHQLTLVDHNGVLHAEREDLDELQLRNRWKYRIALETDGGGRRGTLAEAMAGADVILAASTPVPGTVRPEWVRSMAPHPIVFALANPLPEIWPADARAAGAAVVATGRGDFPNQVNNSLIFPCVFRGVLDARARSIPDEIVIAAAEELARCTSTRGITEQHILPTMDEREVFPHVAAAVAESAVRLGIARVRATREEFYERARTLMARPAALTEALQRSGLVDPMPDEPVPPKNPR